MPWPSVLVFAETYSFGERLARLLHSFRASPRLRGVEFGVIRPCNVDLRPHRAIFIDFRPLHLQIWIGVDFVPPKPEMREIALWPSTNRAMVRFLVLSGILFSITEIPEYTYFSPLKPCCEIKTWKWVEYCGSYYWTHFVFVKHYIHIVLHPCWATVQFLRLQCNFSILGPPRPSPP